MTQHSNDAHKTLKLNEILVAEDQHYDGALENMTIPKPEDLTLDNVLTFHDTISTAIEQVIVLSENGRLPF